MNIYAGQLFDVLVLVSSFNSIEELRNRAEKSKHLSPVYKVSKSKSFDITVSQ
jgi:hypothetical protein